MKVSQEKVFQPIIITIETQEELKVIAAALNASEVSLKEQWENMGYKGSIDTDISFAIWVKINRLVDLNQ